MRAVFQIALGIIAAIGGFVDIGDLVFNTQAGATFGYDVLWAVPIGVLGIMVFAEMTGRVAAVTQRPVFDVIRERMGFNTALVTLIASQIVNVLTVAAEIGGIALILELLFDAPFSLFVIVGAGGLVFVIWTLRFESIERIFGYGGLMLLVYVVVAWHHDPDWARVGAGFAPQLKHSTLYYYFIVGVMAAALMPYEVYFYSSGAVEERWGPKDLTLNRLNAILGYSLGGILALALVIASAEVFQGSGVDPSHLGTVALPAQISYGETGLLLALGGMLFAISGAAIDATFAGAYNIAQFSGWEWGKYRRASGAPRFTFAWMAFLAAGVVIVLTGVDPVEITEYSVVFSVVALPFTYFPVLLIARDRTYMGEHANRPLSGVLGWLYFGVILVLALAAIPLLLATNGGGG